MLKTLDEVLAEASRNMDSNVPRGSMMEAALVIRWLVRNGYLSLNNIQENVG